MAFQDCDLLPRQVPETRRPVIRCRKHSLPVRRELRPFDPALVPAEHRQENIPCHHIPLNARGESVDDLEGSDNQQNMEENLAVWLRAAIRQLEAERASRPIE